MSPQSTCIGGCKVTLVALVWLFPTMHLQMCTQTRSIGRCKFTVVAFVCLFSALQFQMLPQIASISGCILTLVAFVQLFSTVYFQMCPQNVCIRGCKVTLVAFVCLFSTVHFQMSLQTACPRRCIVTLVAFVWLNDSIRLFLQDFPILQTKTITFKSLVHCQRVLCFAQVVASNWVISMIEIWLKSTSVNFQWHTFTLFRQMGLVGLGWTTGRGSKTLSKIFSLAPNHQFTHCKTKAQEVQRRMLK